jgi:peptidoglycan/LPS O-acetylase OafA/YrhL
VLFSSIGQGKAAGRQTLAEGVDRVRERDIPALTGLRFIAAISVVIAHGSEMILKYQPADALKNWLPLSAGFGMILFFVLSGFVIHYNYRVMVAERGAAGIGEFLWARFARLYPLFLFVLLLDVLLGRKLFDFMAGSPAGFGEVLRSLPYYLLFLQSWVYVPFGNASLIYVTGPNVALTWSISTEWFFYLAYPAVAMLLLRVRRTAPILTAMLATVLLWGGAEYLLDGKSAAIDHWAAARYGDIAGEDIGTQDSFIRWITYFSPYLRIGEFILGCLTAQLYLRLRDRPVSPLEQRAGLLMLAVALVGVFVVTFLTYSSEHRSRLLFGVRHDGLAPIVAVIVFATARYNNPITRVLRAKILVALGEASYSIYLFHFLILLIAGSYLGTLPATSPNLAYLGLRFAFVVSLICVISLGTHAIIEVPSRRWLRATWKRPPAWVGAGAGLPVLAALASLVLNSHNAPQTVTDGIRLVSATYGGNCGASPGNATFSVSDACNAKDRCSYRVDVVGLGDPAGGCAKDFSAVFTCMPAQQRHRVTLPAEAGFGSQLLLSCGAKGAEAAAVQD